MDCGLSSPILTQFFATNIKWCLIINKEDHRAYKVKILIIQFNFIHIEWWIHVVMTLSLSSGTEDNINTKQFIRVKYAYCLQWRSTWGGYQGNIFNFSKTPLIARTGIIPSRKIEEKKRLKIPTDKIIILPNFSSYKS